MAALSREVSDAAQAAAGAVSDDEHDPDGSTTVFGRAQVAALLEQARGQLIAVERAEQRLCGGSYGPCLRCGGPIGAERLPATAHCITCATGLSR